MSSATTMRGRGLLSGAFLLLLIVVSENPDGARGPGWGFWKMQGRRAAHTCENYPVEQAGGSQFRAGGSLWGGGAGPAVEMVESAGPPSAPSCGDWSARQGVGSQGGAPLVGAGPRDRRAASGEVC